MDRKQATSIAFLLALASIALYFCYLIAKPFLRPVFLAFIIAIVFQPIHLRISSRIGNKNVGAILSTILVLVAVVLPAVALGIVVSREIGELYQLLSQRTAGQGGWNPYATHSIELLFAWVGRYVDLSNVDVRAALLRWLEQLSRSLFSWGTQVLGNIVSFFTDAVVATFTLFFLFKEGRTMWARMAALLPLTRDQVERLSSGISSSIVANMYGCMAVGLSQGTLIGIAFWLLGLPSPVLWGLVTALFSLIPIIGSAAVWGPGAIILLITGHWFKAVLLLGWGAAVVGQIDNVVRPYVISEKANLHTLLVFFALLGGVKAFGIMGLFVGPAVLSTSLVLLQIVQERNAESVAS